MKKDIIQNCRKKRLDELAMKCFLRPHQLVKNMNNGRMVILPNEITEF